MKFEEHCRKSKELFGGDGAEFHKWIDQYAKKFGYYHRDILHTREGVEIGVQIFGEIARRHLEQHIKDDLVVEKIPTIQELREEEKEMLKRIEQRRKENESKT